MVRTWVDKAREELRQKDPFLTSPFKHQIQALQQQLRFLKIFFWCFVNGSYYITFEELKASECLRDAVLAIVESSEKTENLDLLASKFLEKVEYFKPILKEAFLDLLDRSQGCKYSSRNGIRELIDFAIKILKDLLVLKPHMIAPVKKKIGAVEKRLECVSAIFHFASREQHVDQFNSLFNHLKNWANSTAGVPFLYWVDELDERVNTKVSLLIQKFKPCTLELAQLYLGALKALKPCEAPDFALKRIAVSRFLDILLEDLFLPVDDGFQIHHEGLIFFISFLMDPAEEYAKDGKLTSRQSNLCVDEAASLIVSLYKCNLKADIAMGRNILLHDLVEKMNQAKAEIKELHLEMPASSWNNFPRTNGQGFLDFFLEDLKEKLKCGTTLTTCEKHQMMIVQKEFLSRKLSLMGIFELQDENEELKDLWTQIIRIAYRVDYVIDSRFFVDATRWRNMMRLSNIIEEIQFIKTELNKSGDTRCNIRVLGDRMNSSGIVPAQATNILMDDVMVGFTEETEKIIDGLTRGSTKVNIVAIVGMAGQGKTTLAEKVYHDSRVQLHFKKYAWCCISKAYKTKDILINILKDINSPVPEDLFSNMSPEELAEKLYRCLKGKNYLIVLDDIWDIGAWNELKESFPDDDNGSRIMFTSRSHIVALEAKGDCSLHELHPLSFEDSWKLLQLKLSFEDGCPLNLVDVRKQIAENCKGLPLAIVLIAGLLAKTDGNLALWKQIAESLSQIAREGCMDILELSYKNLPDYLKPCFLYLGAFREDQAIFAKRLTQLWIAEGFVKKHEMKSLEDVANEYLMDLVARSLLFVAERSSRYGIKRCRVHDLLRELCLEKAKEENFLLAPKFSDDHSFDTMHEQYRLCIHTHCWPFFESEPTAPTVRSLLFSGLVAHSDAPFFFIWFKFLRVLDMECLEIDSNIDAIMQLIHLRYFALRVEWMFHHQ